jgi:hypothetical protein
MGKIGLVHLIYGSFFWIFGMDGLMGMANKEFLSKS